MKFQNLSVKRLFGRVAMADEKPQETPEATDDKPEPILAFHEDKSEEDKSVGKCRLISSQSGVIESCPAGSNSVCCLPVRCAPHKKCCSWTSLFPGLIPK